MPWLHFGQILPILSGCLWDAGKPESRAQPRSSARDTWSCSKATKESEKEAFKDNPGPSEETIPSQRVTSPQQDGDSATVPQAAQTLQADDKAKQDAAG